MLRPGCCRGFEPPDSFIVSFSASNPPQIFNPASHCSSSISLSKMALPADVDFSISQTVFKGEKPKQGFTQPLQCHSFFPTPVKQTASCKARGSHKVKRKKLLLCSAASTSSSFRSLHMPFFYLSFITYHIIPALSFPSCRAPPQFKLCRTKLCLAPLCFILLGLPRRLFVGSLD